MPGRNSLRQLLSAAPSAKCTGPASIPSIIRNTVTAIATWILTAVAGLSLSGAWVGDDPSTKHGSNTSAALDRSIETFGSASTHFSLSLEAPRNCEWTCSENGTWHHTTTPVWHQLLHLIVCANYECKTVL